jgi:hypothetical protein
MTAFVALLTRPGQAWAEIRRQEQANGIHYLIYLLLFALLPPICLYLGTTRAGWSLVAGEQVRLESTSAMQLAVLMYLTIVGGVFIMGAFLRWMSRSFDTRPSYNQCVGFIAYLCTPFYLAGLGALYPSRWVALAVLGVAGLYTSYLLFAGLPRFMRLEPGRSLLFAACAWAVGLLVLVNIKVAMILVWQLGFHPTYERTVVQDQAAATSEQRAEKVPEGL